jgi:hypothetical protein
LLKAGKPLPVPHSFEEHEQQFCSEGASLRHDHATITTLPFALFPFDD